MIMVVPVAAAEGVVLLMGKQHYHTLLRTAVDQQHQPGFSAGAMAAPVMAMTDVICCL
jgi:hypothetical protein